MGGRVGGRVLVERVRERGGRKEGGIWSTPEGGDYSNWSAPEGGDYSKALSLSVFGTKQNMTNIFLRNGERKMVG
jgi:hypothetical protein